MIRMLRELEFAIGSGTKDINDSELPARMNARRSIVVNGTVKKGEKFTLQNTIMKRPGSGISPKYIDELIGLTASKDLIDDHVITPQDIVEDTTFERITAESLASGSFSHCIS